MSVEALETPKARRGIERRFLACLPADTPVDEIETRARSHARGAGLRPNDDPVAFETHETGCGDVNIASVWCEPFTVDDSIDPRAASMGYVRMSDWMPAMRRGGQRKAGGAAL